MTNANTMSIEDVLNDVDMKHRLSPYLKLRGHISFKAAKLAGQYLAKQAKLIKDSEDEDLIGLDTFNKAMGYLRGQSNEELLLDEMGLEGGTDMLVTVKALVLYANKLNFDIQEIIDPTGNKRNDPTWKTRGVYFTEFQQRQSWNDSVALLAEGDKNSDLDGTYAEYTQAVGNPEWTLSEIEWAITQTADTNIYEEFGAHVVDLIMDIGEAECDFDELPIRTQIAAIENMRGKIPSMIEAGLKSFKYDRADKATKLAEASKLKGLINGFNIQFCQMLDGSRYANFAEYMYNYIPQTAQSTPVTRRMIARKEVAMAAIDSREAAANIIHIGDMANSAF